MKKVLTIATLIAVMLLLFETFSPVQAQIGLESRLLRVESEIIGLQSQISQLSAGRNGVSVPAPSTSVTSRRAIQSNDPQFDRLATLVIELRERIQTLEAKVAKLQGR